MKKFFLLSALFLISFVSTHAIAQSVAPSQAIGQDPLNPIPGLTQCESFIKKDNFRFIFRDFQGSVTPGQIVNIEGDLTNASKLLLDNADLYVLVEKIGSSTSEIIHYEKYGKSIHVSPEQSTSVSYDWQVPPSIPQGKYKVGFLIVTGGKKVIPVESGLGSFDVGGSNQDTIQITSVRIVPGTGPTDSIAVQIRNTGSEAITVPLSIKTYFGDNLNGKVVETKNSSVKVAARSSAQVEVPISKVGPIQKTILVGYKAGFNFTKNYLIRSATTNSALLGIGGFSEVDGEISMFTCLGGADFEKLTKTKVSFEVSNKSGVIKTFDWSGFSTSTKGAVYSKLGSSDVEKVGGFATLTISLFRDGSQVDKIAYLYSCESSDVGGLCGTKTTAEVVQGFFSKYKTIVITLLVIALGFLLVSTGVYRKVVNKKLFFLVLLVMLSFAAHPEKASADWRSELKNAIYNSDGNYSDYNWMSSMYDFGNMTANFFTSNYELTPAPARDVINRAGYINGSEGKLTADGYTYEARGDQLNPNRNFIELPIWMGVYVIDAIRPTSRNGYGNYFYGYQIGTHTYSPAQIKTTLAQDNWSIPVGTRIGFLVSATNPTNNNFMMYGAGNGGLVPVNVGTYVSTLPTGSLSPCQHDAAGGLNYFPNDAFTRPSNSCISAHGTGNPNRNMSMSMIRPQVSLIGLDDHFSCEALQSDGTMECVAVSPGTSTPRLQMGSTNGRIRGTGTYNTYLTGKWYVSGVDGNTYYQDRLPDTEAPLLLSSNHEQPDVGFVSIITYTGATSSDNWWASNFIGHAYAQTLPDGGTGFTLPAGPSQVIFGNIIITEAAGAPTAPQVSAITQWPYYGGSTRYVFQATSTDPNTNQGLYYEADTDNNGTVDEYVRLDQTYMTKGNDQTKQPGWIDDGSGGSLGYFAWDYWGRYVPSGYPLRFNGLYDTNSGSHTIKVRAVDNTDLRSPWTTYTFTMPTPIGTPQNFTSDIDYSAQCLDGLNLSWDEVVGATGYKLYRYDSDSNGNTVLIATIPAGTATYHDTNIPDGYVEYQLTAYDAESESEPAFHTINMPVSCNAVLPPVLTATKGTVCGGNINLSWTIGNNALNYQIETFNQLTYEWDVIDTVPASQRTYTHNAGIGVTQYYRVKSVAGAVVSDPSNEAYADGSKSCLVSNPPSNAHGQKGSVCGFKTDFTWSPPSSGTAPNGYYLYQYWYGWFYLLADIPGGSSTSYTHVGSDTSPAIYAMSSYGDEGESDPVYVNPTTVNGEPSGQNITPSRDCNTPTQCSDTLDNDGNGKIDFTGGPNGEPADLDYCVSEEDDLEGDPGCLRGNVSRLEGETYKFYSTILASSTVGCENYAKTFTCLSGVWKDSNGNIDNGTVYKYPYCRLNANVFER